MYNTARLPPLANPQHETFAQAVVSGCSLTEAAKRSGHLVGAPNFGSRLVEQPQVSQRIIELQADQQTPGNPQETDNPDTPPSSGVDSFVQKKWVITELVSIERLARKERDIAGMHACVKTLAQIGGLLDSGGRNVDPSRDPQRIALMGIREIHAMLSQVVGGAPRPERAKLLVAAPELRELVGDLDAEPEEAAAPKAEAAGDGSTGNT